jgi:Flp pilus assembly protein TadB
MKKIIVLAFFAIVALNATTVLADEPKVNTTSSSTTIQTDQSQLTAEQMQQMVTRVYEIRDMDKSHLTLEQKKGLKSELRSIKSKLQSQKDPVVFVASGSAILLIIILLIILL